MNIDDKKLNELMDKTENLIKRKKVIRRFAVVSSIGAFLAIAALALNFVMLRQVPDKVINGENNSFAAAQDNKTSQPTPTPLPWNGATWNPDAEPTPTVPDEIPNNAWELWTESREVNGKNISVTISLEVISLPYTEVLSVVNVTPGEFDIEFAKKAVEYFLGDKYYDTTSTKEDFQTQIDILESNLQQDSLEDYQIENINEIIESLRKSKESAPINNIEGTTEFSDDGNLFLKSYLGENYIEDFAIRNNGINHTFFSYVRDSFSKTYTTSVFDDDYMEPIGMKNPDEASKKAREAVEYICGDDMILSFVSYGKIYQGYTFKELDEMKSDRGTDEVYILYFTRSYGAGAKVICGQNLVFDSEDYDPNNEPWEEEYVRVVVDDAGIAEFQWFSKTETVSVVDNSPSIITTGEAIEIFKSSIFESQSWQSDIEIEISSIELVMTKIQDDNGLYLITPAYTFKGELAIIQGNDKFYYLSDTDNANILVINATDGSIIN